MQPAIRWRRIFPRSVGDRVSIVFSVCELTIAGLFELLVILPRKYPEATTGYWLSVALGAFLFVNTVGNLLMAMSTELGSGAYVLPSVLKPGWGYCYQCKQNSPPRSFHCVYCDACVLKRDHHCLFIGACVGHTNQRYYLLAIMYIGLGALYAAALNAEFLAESVAANLHWSTLLAALMPMIGWAIALFRPVSFFIAFQSGMSILGAVGFTGLFGYHAVIALRGQTTHELRRIQDRSYDLGWRQNLREVLGVRWYLAWLFPLIRSPLPGDGIHFKKRSAIGLEEVKDL